MKVLAHIAPQVLLIAALDFALGFASLYLAYFLVHSAGFAAAVSGGPGLFWRGVVLAVCLILSLASMGLYNGNLRYGIEAVLARMLVGVGFAAIGIALLEFLFRFVGSRPVWVLALGLSAVLLGTGRAVFARFADGEMFRRRVLIYGAGKRASRILELRRRSDQRGFRVVAFIPAAGDLQLMDDPRVLKREVHALQDYVRTHQVDEIVVALDDRRRSFPVADLLACKLSGTRVVDLLEFLERETGRVKVDMVNPAWLIFSTGFNRTGAGLSFRILDLICATVFCVLALPVGLLVAFAILLDDGAPVFYRQHRVGLNGKEFLLYKFRSMRNGAEANGRPQWATREDARATRVGKWLRKFRLDELPQLINVFKGDMSFVGPRPERPEFVKELACRIPYYHERHCVKPGVTGWAQLCYPYGASEADSQAKLEFDMYYVKHRSLVFNLMILLQTVEVVLWQKGSR